MCPLFERRARQLAGVDRAVVEDQPNRLDRHAGDGTRAAVDLLQKSDEYERRFLAEGTLTREQVENCRILRRTMQQAGFRQLPNEWWHFDALPKAEVRRSRRIFE
ncbi:MAG: hypothetical protein M3145_08405, partial [Pseudomonadota bacterium]|nr:hypothetical protein [Pseudomonadota bacterium]